MESWFRGQDGPVGGDTCVAHAISAYEGTDGLEHEAVFYRDLPGYVDAVASFIREGLAADEAVMVSVPGQRIDPLRTALGADASKVTFFDMTLIGQNPSRIIPTVRQFVDAHRSNGRVRFVGEPIWVGRTAAEIREATRHEALLNVAFIDAPVTILCPYQATELDLTTLSNACRTHPVLVEHGHRRPSSDYTDPLNFYAATNWPLPAPPADAARMEFGAGSLPQVRAFVTEHVRDAGLIGDRADDLLLAVNEAATNSLVHGGGSGVLRVWRDDASGTAVCEVRDSGRIKDPLVGRVSPQAGAERGRGLWLVHQFCDLAEVQSDAVGTTVRMHASLTAP